MLDAELQQRACEYLALTQRNDEDELLQVVCEEMPPFPERESALVNRLHSKADATQDKRTWVIGGKDENKGREAARFRSFSNVQASDRPEPSVTIGAPAAAAIQSPVEMDKDQVGVYDMMGAESSAATDDVMSSLAGLDLGGATAQEAPLLPAATQPALVSVDSSSAGTSTAPQISTSAALAAMSLTKGPGIEKVSASKASSLYKVADSSVVQWLERLIYNSEGVLYEDEQLQIGVKAEYHGNLGRLAIYIGNKIPQPFTAFSATIETAEPDALNVDFHKPPATEIAGLAQVQYLLQIECKSPFTTLPILKMSFIAGTVRNLVLKLPVFLSKFVEPVQLDSAAFFGRWKAIGGGCGEKLSSSDDVAYGFVRLGAPRESQKIFPIHLSADGTVDTGRHGKVIGGQKFALLDKVDPNPNNVSHRESANT